MNVIYETPEAEYVEFQTKEPVMLNLLELDSMMSQGVGEIPFG